MKMLMTIAYRNIWRNKRRTVFCLSAVAFAVLFIVIYSSMIDGMLNSIHSIVQTFTHGHVRVVSAQYDAESERMPVQYPVADGKDWRLLADEIKNISGVRAVFPRVTAMATLQESTIKHAVLWGLNINDETAFHNFNITNKSDGLIDGRYPAPNSNECAVGHLFAKKTGLKIGDRVPLKTISAQFSDKIWSPVITGIFTYDSFLYDETYIVVDFERLERLLVLDGGTQQLLIYADDDYMSAGIAQAIEKILGDGNVVAQWRDDYWVAVMEAVRPVYMMMFLVFLIVASFLIINTVVMIIHERIKEIGMMGALGMTRFEIVTVFFFESLFLASLGAFAGVAVGGLLTGALSNYPINFGALYGNMFSEMPMCNCIFFSFRVRILIEAWLMGVIVASIFTLLPALKSAFVEPVEALRR